MKVVIHGTEMYLELARAFAGAQVELPAFKPNLHSPDDLPILTQLNLQFVMSAIAVVFSVSYLEANVNRWLHQLLNGELELTELNMPAAEVRLKANGGIKELQKAYPDLSSRDKLFGQVKLTEKVKLLYKTLGTQLPFDSDDISKRKLWNDLIGLQDLRNELIHLKPSFYESKRFLQFLRADKAERERLVAIPMTIVAIMSECVPVLAVNSDKNVIISGAILQYADIPFLETLMLGHDLSDEDRRVTLSRRPYSTGKFKKPKDHSRST
jgi:hypothetical protein